MKVFVKNIREVQASMDVLFHQAEKAPDVSQEIVVRHVQKDVPIRCILTGSKVKMIVWYYKKPGTVNWARSTRADIIKHVQSQFGWAPTP